MAYTTIHVNGPSIVKIAKAGVTPVRFGVTDEGVTLSFSKGITPVMADDTGDFHPADLQYMAGICNISGRFTRWEESIMETVRSCLPDRAAGTILDADIGTLLFASGEHWNLYIESAARTGLSAESPWNFPCVVPTDAFSLNLGTRYSKAAFGFTAYFKNGVLYTRV